MKRIITEAKFLLNYFPKHPMPRYNRNYLLLGIWISLIACFTLIRLLAISRENWADLEIYHVWMTLHFSGTPSNILQDGIPDGWLISNWGNARAIHELDTKNPYHGKQSLLIQKNNDVDASVTSQTINIPALVSISCNVSYLGQEAFIAIRDHTGQNLTFATLPVAPWWTAQQVTFSNPGGPIEGTFYLGIALTGKTWLDQASCTTNEDQITNLLRNGDFEEDGLVQDPFQWWQSLSQNPMLRVKGLTAASQIVNQRTNRNQNGNLINAVGLLLGNIHSIDRPQVDEQPVDARCENDQQGFLIGLGHSWQQDGGLTAREKMDQLAIELFPDCPLAYADLADLYSENSGYPRAASLYYAAMNHTIAGPQRSFYAFETGRLEMMWLGDWQRAVETLKIAGQTTGWEPSPYYYGLDLLMLGEAYSNLGFCSDANAAYQHILNCKDCYLHYEEAHIEIEKLKTCTP